MMNDYTQDPINLSPESVSELEKIQELYRELNLTEPTFEELVNNLIQENACQIIIDIKDQIFRDEYARKLHEDDEDAETNEDEDNEG